MWHRVALVRTDVTEERILHHQGEKKQRATSNISSNWQPKHPDDGGDTFLRIVGS
jgi:hypothetical protein